MLTISFYLIFLQQNVDTSSFSLYYDKIYIFTAYIYTTTLNNYLLTRIIHKAEFDWDGEGDINFIENFVSFSCTLLRGFTKIRSSLYLLWIWWLDIKTSQVSPVVEWVVECIQYFFLLCPLYTHTHIYIYIYIHTHI